MPKCEPHNLTLCTLFVTSEVKASFTIMPSLSKELVIQRILTAPVFSSQIVHALTKWMDDDHFLPEAMWEVGGIQTKDD